MEEVAYQAASSYFNPMRRLILTLLSATLLVACSDKSKSKIETPTAPRSGDSILFNSPYDSLETLSLPITLDTDVWDSLYFIHLDKYGPGEAWEITKRPYMKIAENEHFKAIIFIRSDESGAPVVITIDSAGQQIDGVALLGDWTSNDPSSWTTELATVDKDLTIHLLDSVSSFQLDPDGARIDSTRVLEIKHEYYKINHDGKVERIIK